MTLREQIARLIYGEHDGYPFEDPCAPSGNAYVKADAIIALLPALPPGYVAVPEEPTQEMLKAAGEAENFSATLTGEKP